MSEYLASNLELLRAETELLLRSAAELDGSDVGEPSLCEGWTRGHVLTHIARNADGIANLVRWAVTGKRCPMYASPQAREADIEAGSSRGMVELLTDLEDSAARLEATLTTLVGDAELAEVEARGGVWVRGNQLPAMRLREVVFHHVDLQVGYGFADSDPGYVHRSLDDAVERLKSAEPAPVLTLRSDEGDVWSIGDGSAYVTGSRAALLLWLARGVARGVRPSEGQRLPTVPAWG